MRWLIDSSRLPLVVVAVLVGLLAVLATLQYRWIAQLSEAERARLQEELDRSADGFCEALDLEITRAFTVFSAARPDDNGELSRVLSDRLTEWRSAALWPGLVKELAVIRPGAADEVELLCYDESSRMLRQCRWSDELQPIRHRLRNPGPELPVIDAILPGLVLAIREAPHDPNQPPEWRPPRDHLIVRFDLDVVAEVVLPQLAEDHLGMDGDRSYLLVVSSGDLPGKVVFRTGTMRNGRASKPDATGRLFGLRSSPEPAGFAGDDARARRPPPRERGPARRPGPPRPDQPPPGLHGRSEEGHWSLAVWHPEGSLEDVVAKARRRNMAISLAILVMLGATAVLMVASTRRSRQLARQQMDFVAAVSHELRTPLTAIRSAGQNLADGIVKDTEKVQSYGSLIEREGRRLTEMIGRVLTFAGIRSGRQIYRMEPVDVSDIVRAALKDGAWVLSESGFEIETEIADSVPPVNGDKVALRQVVANLIDNALKYAAGGRWLGVDVGFEGGGDSGEVWISVSDHGPGIPKRDLALVFEPFHRGSQADGGIPGSGLGLAVVRSIVEAHGGAIDVDSVPGRGTTFVVRLPTGSARSAETRNDR